MAMTGANYDKHFANLGVIVRIHNLIEALLANIRAEEELAANIMNDDEDEVISLSKLLVVTRSLADSTRSYLSQVGAVASAYCQEGLRKDIGYTGSSKTLTDILEDLTEDMEEADESCDASVIASANLAYDADNSGTGILTVSNLTQLLTDESFELECTSISGGIGAETWEVRGEPDEPNKRRRHGTLPNALTTGQTLSAVDRNSQALFSLALAAYAVDTGYELAGDIDGELATYTFSGASKGTNTDSAGDVFMDLDRLAEFEAGDNNNQISGWANITGAKLAGNTDVDGKIHLSIIDDGGGFFHIELFSDVARTLLVAHTATYNGAGAKALVEDNTSGIGGTITVDLVIAVDVDISCVLAFDRVRVYKDAPKANMVCIGGSVAGGATTLYAQNASGLAGTVATAYNDGEVDVQVRIGFAFAVGDKIRFDTTSDEAGTFVEFFRKQLNVAPRTNAAGGETVDDALAE